MIEIIEICVCSDEIQTILRTAVPFSKNNVAVDKQELILSYFGRMGSDRIGLKAE